jgi:hypothetical protein
VNDPVDDKYKKLFEDTSLPTKRPCAACLMESMGDGPQSGHAPGCQSGFYDRLADE